MSYNSTSSCCISICDIKCLSNIISTTKSISILNKFNCYCSNSSHATTEIFLYASFEWFNTNNTLEIFNQFIEIPGDQCFIDCLNNIYCFAFCFSFYTRINFISFSLEKFRGFAFFFFFFFLCKVE